MQKMIQRYLIIFLLTTMASVSWGFSLLGPYEPWEAVTIGYNQGYEMSGNIPGGPVWLGDIGGPHNLGEEYRRNVRVLYYAYDQSFLSGDYFGTNGTVAVDSAFAIMNSLTNVDSYSSDLSEFPLTSQHYNYTAQSLYMTDLRSATLHLLVEQLGLADPARYSWTLHDRFPGSSCPVTTSYLVVQRNFDGTVAPSLQTSAYSPYVNGTLLSYYITEHCSGPPPALAKTVPFLVDADGQEFAPVAANNFQEFEAYDTAQLWHIPTIYGLQIGGFYTGLTRDDVAGLRYLYSTNNINIEPVAAGSQALIISTNFNTQALFPDLTGTNTFASGTNGAGAYYYDGTYGYGDYGALVAASKTNSPAVMQLLYPGLGISSSSNYFAIATNETVTSYYTNLPGSAYGTQTFVVTTNYSYYLQEYFVTTFANVFTNRVYPNTTYTLQTATVGPKPGSQYGSPATTNITSQTIVLSNAPSGDFFLLPLFHTTACPLDIIYTGLTNVMSFTNVLTVANTNVTASTNITSTNALYGSVSSITYFTNYTFVVYSVTCDLPTNYVNKFQGLGGVRFAYQPYDTLLEQFNPPITNDYTMYYETTNHLIGARKILRVITQPDVLIQAADLADGPAGINFNYTVRRNNMGFAASQSQTNSGGPGIIDSTVVFTYNKVGTIFENGPFTSTNSFINPYDVNETTQVPLLQWASFDGSTNPPVIYPNSTSLRNLEYQSIVQISPTSIPAEPASYYSTNGVQFNIVSGPLKPPYTWSASSVLGQSGSGLPSGLSVTSGGLLYGITTATGTYDFTLAVTDSSPVPQSVQWTYTIILQ